MKNLKLFLILLAAIPLTATASASTSDAPQSRAVERLASKWENRDEVSVVTIRNLFRGASLKVTEGVDVSDFVADISGITIVSNETGDGEFTRDVRRIVSDGDYTEFMTVSEGGERVAVLYGDLPGGNRNHQELLITVTSSGKTTLISVVGRIRISEKKQ
jgi:hypothetical protein